MENENKDRVALQQLQKKCIIIEQEQLAWKDQRMEKGKIP